MSKVNCTIRAGTVVNTTGPPKCTTAAYMDRGDETPTNLATEKKVDFPEVEEGRSLSAGMWKMMCHWKT